jgi:hypothetical protein
LKAEDVQQYINNPCNALNIQNDAHDSMDKHMAWGIEAKLCDNQVCLYSSCSCSWIHIQIVEILFPSRATEKYPSSYQTQRWRRNQIWNG